MSVRVRCPECNVAAVVPDELRGKMVRCPKCREAFRADRDNLLSAIQQAPGASPRPIPDALPARGRAPEPALRRPPVKAPASSHRMLIIVGAAAAALFLLFVVIGGVGAALLLFQRSSSVPTPAPVAAPTVAAPAPVAAVAPPAVAPADNLVPLPATDNSQFHLADVRRSVVFIRRSTPGLPTATGTGFFVTRDGMIATNRHVIQAAAGPNPATVLYVGVPSAADPDSLDYFKAKVAFCPPVNDTLDFALLKIAPRPGYQAFRPLPLSTAKLDLGAPAAAIGFPFAAVEKPVLSFNKGSISATRREFDGHPFYQTDAAVNPGNSGGPLVNADGQAVGVVSLKLDDANNMGYALYMNETGMPGLLNQPQMAAVQPEAGPLDPKQLPASGATKRTRMASWQVTHGLALEDDEDGLLLAMNRGASYWLTNNEPLPENFQLNVECFVVPLTPDSRLPFGNRPFGPPIPPPIILPRLRPNPNFVQSLYVRFGTDAVDQEITSLTGTTLHLAAGVAQVAENGGVVFSQRKEMPRNMFLLNVTRSGDELTVAVDGEVWAKQKLLRAQQGSHKFSIGGLQSGLALRGVSVTPIDGPPVPAPLPGDPPKSAPAAPPAGLAFDAGWDKPTDPDGDCKVVADKASLTIEAPAKRHDLTVDQNVMNAPRLTRDATGDFTAQVRVGGDFQPAAPSTNPAGVPYVGAGIVVTAGDKTCLRLERAAVNRNGVTIATVNWEAHMPGHTRVASSGLRADEPPVYLRLRRQGDVFYPAFSRDGNLWIELPQQPMALPAAVKVGVAAVTSSAAPFKASYDDFRLGASGEAAPVAGNPPNIPNVNPPGAPDPATWVAKPPAGWKGPEWTNDLDKMKVPDGPASGWVLGADYKVDDASVNGIGFMTLHQGGQPGPSAYLTLMLPNVHKLADLEGKTFTVNGKQQISGLIWAHLGRTQQVDGRDAPKVQIFGEYTMKLEFGKGEGLKLPGTIYICFPDEGKSVIAGTFLLESK